jgi:hypothetical protein
MARIELFCEDAAHESCARALVRRCGDEEQVAVGVHVAAARFGIPRLKRELGAFQAVVRQRAGTPDILVVLIDANRVGVAGRRGEVEDALEPGLFPHVVIGTPDPCVERWLLADPPSFTQLYGREPDVSVFIAAIGIILRGTSYALRAGEPGPREEGALSVVFALSSILTPFALGAALGGIASGRVPVGNAGGEPFGSWINPTSLLVGVLAVVSAAYLAAVNLAGDARRAQLPEMASLFRARALRAGGLLGGLAVAGPLVLHADARPLYDGLSSGGGLVAGFVSGAAGVTALALVYRGRFDLARGSAALAVTAIIAGWALAQQPFRVDTRRSRGRPLDPGGDRRGRRDRLRRAGALPGDPLPSRLARPLRPGRGGAGHREGDGPTPPGADRQAAGRSGDGGPRSGRQPPGGRLAAGCRRRGDAGRCHARLPPPGRAGAGELAASGHVP